MRLCLLENDHYHLCTVSIKLLWENIFTLMFVNKLFPLSSWTELTHPHPCDPNLATSNKIDTSHICNLKLNFSAALLLHRYSALLPIRNVWNPPQLSVVRSTLGSPASMVKTMQLSLVTSLLWTALDSYVTTGVSNRCLEQKWATSDKLMTPSNYYT